MRRDERAVGRRLACEMHLGARLHGGDMRIEPRLRLGVDDRADMHGNVGRIADLQLPRRADDHGDHLVRHMLLDAEQPERRAALPAERNADITTSSVTCSGRAVPSTIMALMPPVSAISGTIGPSLAASARLISRATSVEPVKATPATAGCWTSAAPTRPSPTASCSASCGTPAAWNSRTASAAIRGVCSAGLAMTALPATSAADTWPRKIASGKFQGLMQTKMPRPFSFSLFSSPVGPGSSTPASLKCLRASAA